MIGMEWPVLISAIAASVFVSFKYPLSNFRVHTAPFMYQSIQYINIRVKPAHLIFSRCGRVRISLILRLIFISHLYLFMLVTSPALPCVDHVLDVIGDRALLTVCPARLGCLAGWIDLAHHRLTVEAIGDLEGYAFRMDDLGVSVDVFNVAAL